MAPTTTQSWSLTGGPAAGRVRRPYHVDLHAGGVVTIHGPVRPGVAHVHAPAITIVQPNPDGSLPIPAPAAPSATEAAVAQVQQRAEALQEQLEGLRNCWPNPERDSADRDKALRPPARGRLRRQRRECAFLAGTAGRHYRGNWPYLRKFR